MDANPNGDDALEEFKKATCLIQTDNSEGNPYNAGTGFFFGGGWIMSVAHNFQNDDAVPEQLHSLLSEARFRFVVNGRSYCFPPDDQPPQRPIRRMAFIHHLRPGENVHPNNMDIAMVKLGKQYEYGNRREFQDWEIAEETQLQRMNVRSGFATLDDPATVPGDTVHAIHCGGQDPNVGRTRLTVEETLNVRNEVGNPDRIPIMRLRPALNPTALGCPIINRKLVGLLVSCGEDTKPRRSMALMWNRDISQHIITKKVPIIAEIGKYMAHTNEAIGQEAAANARRNLEEMARNGRLTIYLMNGVVISGPLANDNRGILRHDLSIRDHNINPTTPHNRSNCNCSY